MKERSIARLISPNNINRNQLYIGRLHLKAIYGKLNRIGLELPGLKLSESFVGNGKTVDSNQSFIYIRA